MLGSCLCCSHLDFVFADAGNLPVCPFARTQRGCQNLPFLGSKIQGSLANSQLCGCQSAWWSRRTWQAVSVFPQLARRRPLLPAGGPNGGGGLASRNADQRAGHRENNVADDAPVMPAKDQKAMATTQSDARHTKDYSKYHSQVQREAKERVQERGSK